MPQIPVSMKKIQMVDLQRQYAKIKETVDISIEEVLNSSAYINGPYVHQFQSRFRKIFNCKTCYSLCKWNRCFTDSNDGL